MSLTERQHVALAQMEAETIPHGATFPLELIAEFVPIGGLVIDAGCGTGKSIRLEEAGYGVIGLDLNRPAIREAKTKGMYAFKSDVTVCGVPGYPYSNLVSVELAGAVLAEGLLCNLMGDDSRRFMRVADFYLAPGGYLLIADILQPREEDVPFLKERLTSGEASALVEAWRWRYEANAELGLPYGTFLVAKPGPAKHRNWGDQETLEALISSCDFERYARHYTVEEIRALTSGVGLVERHFVPTIFYTRTGKPLLGFWAAFQKENCYRYTPGYAGMTRGQRQGADDFGQWKGWMEGVSSQDFFNWWAEELKRNLPDWEEIFPQLKDLQR